MDFNTAKVVLEGPTGEERAVENVKSLTTRDDGTIDAEIAGEQEMVEIGWDWTIVEVYAAWSPDVSEGDVITYTDNECIKSGEVVNTDHDGEIIVKQHPDGFQVSISPGQIIPG